MYRYWLLFLFCMLFFRIDAGEHYRFRVYLKDKGDSGFRLEKPELFLSEPALERRKKQAIPISESDLPISESYLRILSETGVTPVVQSKWFATVVVESEDSTVVDKLKACPIIDSVRWVWKGISKYPAETVVDTSRLQVEETPLPRKRYGYAERQIHMLNGVKLHQAGFMGENVRVAVIDAGFLHVDRIEAFDSLRLLGTRNVVFPGRSVYVGDDHGTKVLSCLAANLPGVMVGTAPHASYFLIKSEDSDSEYPIEEDFWVAAVEYADSVGVDVISSSLGYFSFDACELSYTHSDLNGKKTLISRAATLAAEKGILLFCSAGNEGNGDWGKITFPADADAVLTVGAVTEKKKRSTFSSFGFTADNRVKPDVVALGTGCCVIGPFGQIRYANGTSFATPVLAGMGICLRQAFPQMTNRELIDLIQRSSSLWKKPDTGIGYGVPDMYKAYKKGRKYVAETK